MTAAERCPECKRPVWDGGHAINDEECCAEASPGIGDLACRSIGRALTAEQRANAAEARLVVPADVGALVEAFEEAVIDGARPFGLGGDQGQLAGVRLDAARRALTDAIAALVARAEAAESTIRAQTDLAAIRETAATGALIEERVRSARLKSRAERAEGALAGMVRSDYCEAIRSEAYRYQREAGEESRRADRLAAALAEACNLIDDGSAYCGDCGIGTTAPAEWRALATDTPAKGEPMTPPTEPLDLAALRKAHEAMTPGEWEWTPYLNNHPEGGGTISAARGVIGDIETAATAYSSEEAQANGSGIVAEHNAFGAMLDEIERLRDGLLEACEIADANIGGSGEGGSIEDALAHLARLRALVKPQSGS